MTGVLAAEATGSVAATVVLSIPFVTLAVYEVVPASNLRRQQRAFGQHQAAQRRVVGLGACDRDRVGHRLRAVHRRGNHPDGVLACGESHRASRNDCWHNATARRRLDRPSVISTPFATLAVYAVVPELNAGLSVAPAAPRLRPLSEASEAAMRVTLIV